MKNFTAFVKNKFVLAFFFLAILYPLLMLGIFLPSYAHINNSIEDISVVIVDQDNNYGAELTEALESQLPFTIIDDLSYEEALAELDQAKVAMVINIPADFSAKKEKNTEILAYLKKNQYLCAEFYFVYLGPNG